MGGNEEAQLISDTGSQMSDIARTEGQIADQAGRTAMAEYGTGSDIQRAIQAATAAMQGQSVLAGAAGAVAGELAGSIAKEIYGKEVAELSESQKQTISSLATIAAGIAGGLAGDGTAAALAGAQSGKTVVENNSMSELVPPRVQQAASLAFDPRQQGKSAEEISDAINASHMGPSWGTEYKVKPNGKAEISGDVGFALKGGAEINNAYFSVSTGYTKEFGVKAGATIGVDFGPYVPGIFGNLNRDYSAGIGFGPGAVGMSAGKDGIGFSFSVGPSIGFTGSSTHAQADNLELNGDLTKEIYRHDFK